MLRLPGSVEGNLYTMTHPCGSFVRIPPSCQGVDIVIGIDEAGRGPVLGPLIYAAAFWPVSEDADIKKMCNFDDSKKLKEGEREKGNSTGLGATRSLFISHSCLNQGSLLVYAEAATYIFE